MFWCVGCVGYIVLNIIVLFVCFDMNFSKFVVFFFVLFCVCVLFVVVVIVVVFGIVFVMV